MPTAQSASMGQSMTAGFAGQPMMAGFAGQPMTAGFAGQPMTGEQVMHRGPLGNSPCDLCVQDD